MVRPRIVSYKDLEGSRERFTIELSSAEKTERSLADFYERLNATKANTDDFYKKVLGTKQYNMIAVQRELIEIGNEFRIDPGTVSFSNVDIPEDGLEKFMISLVLEGDYSDLRKFLSRLENSRSFLIVDGISLQGTKEGGLQLLMSINLSTYFDAPWLKGATKRPARAKGGHA